MASSQSRRERRIAIAVGDRARRICTGLALALLALPRLALAGGLDLRDPTPRWVEVAFEISPQEAPGELRSRFSAPFLAWLEPGPEPGQARITIGRQIVERHLLSDQDPVPGSFSDFVWVFDVATGDVLSASLTGDLVRPMDLGFVRARAVTHVSVEMSSRELAGFRRTSRLLGHELHRFCDDRDSMRCRIVPGKSLDPASGYVNAVGAIAARTGPVEVRTFSPLGEAIFRERGDGVPDVAAGPTPPVAADSEMPALLAR